MSANEELHRLKKATVYADILDASGIGPAQAKEFGEGQWNMVALALAQEVNPRVSVSLPTRSVVIDLLQQRSHWRQIGARV